MTYAALRSSGEKTTLSISVSSRRTRRGWLVSIFVTSQSLSTLSALVVRARRPSRESASELLPGGPGRPNLRGVFGLSTSPSQRAGSVPGSH